MELDHLKNKKHNTFYWNIIFSYDDKILFLKFYFI